MTSSTAQTDTLELPSTISMITPAEIQANRAQVRYQRCVLIKHDMFPRLSDVQLLIQYRLMDRLTKAFKEDDQDNVWEVPEEVKDSLVYLEKKWTMILIEKMTAVIAMSLIYQQRIFR
ncbi:unnamed protein product [Adineta ricciae]|uniref:Uncharacterized protein n=1 Tax=Adineta ricciae TaxID=249248 RepID=A0A815PJB6_ADIRI|nr:unnamed protein product [Adineta ricciae]